MSIDIIIIADSGTSSVSESSLFRLELDGYPASIQTTFNYLQNNGRVIPPILNDNIFSWSSAPKLNGISLLSTLQKKGYKVSLINDLKKESSLFEKLLKKKPKLIILSTTFILSKADLVETSRHIRKYAGQIPIITGGPFVTQSYQMFLRKGEPEYSFREIEKDFLFYKEETELNIDLYVTSTHDKTPLLMAINRIENNLAFENIPNTAWQDKKGRWHFGTQKTLSHKIIEDDIDWQNLPKEVFDSGVIPLQGSYGCPYRCAFCNFVKTPEATYAKSIEQIIKEMRMVSERGARYIWFVDDVFRLGKRDLNEVAKALIKANLNLKWMTFIRADTVENVDFKLLNQAGCIELQFGIESADPTVLKAMNKQVIPEICYSSIYGAMAAGINVSAYFIFGHPGETENSIERTINFMQSVEFPELPGNFSWSIYPFLLVPLSPIYEADMRLRYQLDGYMMNWQHATMNFNQAIKAIRKAIMALEKSAPISRNDNLELLAALDNKTRKAFFRTRLSLAKLKAKGLLTQRKAYLELEKILNNSA